MSTATSFHVDTADVGGPPSSSSAPTQDGNAKHHVGSEIDFNKGLLDAARDGDLAKLELFLELQAEINTSNSARETPLWLAVNHNVDSVIQFLIKRGADVNAKSCYGETPLYRAVNQNKMRAIQLLLDSKADVNAPKDDGDFPLYLAVSRENEDIVRLLLERGADVNEKGPKGMTPLHRAVSRENEDIVRLLLEHGANVNEKGPKGMIPLHRALYDGNKAIIKLLLDRKANVNAQDNGKTPLYRAFENGNIEVMLLLLEHKATFLAPNAVKNLELSFHVYMGHKDVVEELLRNNADIEEVNNKNMTALHWAAVAGFEELVKLLLERGAKATAGDDEWMTPLHYASQEGHEAVAVLLLNNKATIEMKNDDGMTALHLAAIRGREKVAQLLLKENAYIESRSSSGWTPLHLAAKAGHTNVMEVLCGHKADIESKNQSEGGLTPLLLASGKDRPDTVTWLLRAGANVNARDNGGSTALHWAAYFCQANVAVVLLCRMSDKTVAAKDDNGNTALHLAASEKSGKVAELLSRRMDEDTLTVKNVAGQTAFSIAADNGDKAVLQILVNYEADLTYEDGVQLEAGVTIKPEKINSIGEALLSNMHLWKDSKPGLKTLYWAARNGHLPILSNMLESFPETLRAANPYTVLYWAAFGGQEAAVDFLVGKLTGNDTEAVLGNDDADRALKAAARNGHDEIVGRLLRRMVNPNLDDKMKNWTLLHFVVIYGDIEIFQLMLRNSTHSKAAKRVVLDIAKAVAGGVKKGSGIDGDYEQTMTAVEEILSFIELLKPLENPLRFPPKPPPLERPEQLSNKLDKVYQLINVNITDFYARDGLSPTVETQKSISEVIYGSGPERIMSRIINTWNIRIPSHQRRFRWIHLPANNVSNSCPWVQEIF
jgi:ankyrin repeat protein